MASSLDIPERVQITSDLDLNNNVLKEFSPIYIHAYIAFLPYSTEKLVKLWERFS